MEKNMFLNTNKIRIILLFAVTIVAVSLSSCSDDIPGNEDEPAIVEPGKMLRFGINRNVQTRATHGANNDWYESEFENGDKIGCVIYDKTNNDNFVTLAEFHYSKNQGYLILDNVWDDGTPIKQKVSSIIRRYKDNDTTDGYLKLMNKDGEYGFAFFYPLFNKDMLLEEWNKLTGSNYTLCHVPFSMFFFPATGFDSWHTSQSYNKLMNAGIPFTKDETLKQGGINNAEVIFPTLYDWTKYPVFVGEYQNDPDGDQSQYCNHMWVKCDNADNNKANISNKNKETLCTYELTFKKKLATIDVVISDPDISDEGIFFRHKSGNGNYDSENNRKNVNSGIIRGLELNLHTGKSVNYIHKEWTGNGGSIEYFVLGENESPLPYTDMTRNDFYPLKLKSTTERRWRLILPPQANLEWQLYFNVKEEDKDGKEVSVQKHIDIHEQLTKLEENKLYIIKVMSKQTWGIRIRDWEEKNKGILIED